jgi:hypothetical protein
LGWLDQARAQLAILGKAGGTAAPEAVRLRLGLAQLALHTRQWTQAESLLVAAQAEVAALGAPGLPWLRPAVAYWQGRAHEEQGEPLLARQAYQEGLTAVTQGGNPDELAPLLLRLARLCPADTPRHWEYVEGCVVAVYDRARYVDKMTCLQEAGALLLRSPDARLRRIGSGCLAAVSPQPYAERG